MKNTENLKQAIERLAEAGRHRHDDTCTHLMERISNDYSGHCFCQASYLNRDVDAATKVALEALENLLNAEENPNQGNSLFYNSLPTDEIRDVMSDKKCSDYAVSVSTDFKKKMATVLRGDGTTLSVPFSSFFAQLGNPQPDFHKISIIDHGQTIKFGEYEASMEAILYEFDPDYRRKYEKSKWD